LKLWQLWSVSATVGMLSLAPVTAARAAPTISDPYLQPNCASGCDVIGANADFDIQKIVFTSLTSSSITAQIYTNYHSGAAGLAPWSESGITLSIGDLMFQEGSDEYVVPLHDHGLFHAGQLYSVTELLTAQTVLGNPSGVSYRNGEYVWGGGTPTAIGAAGSVSVACANGEAVVGGQCPSGGELIVTATFHPDSAFWNDLSTQEMTVDFAAATCANDVISGFVDPVPAPATGLLLGGGLLGMGARLRRRVFGRWRS
jgi:hypothetical protein